MIAWIEEKNEHFFLKYVSVKFCVKMKILVTDDGEKKSSAKTRVRHKTQNHRLLA